jgi:hypothetical protein
MYSIFFVIIDREKQVLPLTYLLQTIKKTIKTKKNFSLIRKTSTVIVHNITSYNSIDFSSDSHTLNLTKGREDEGKYWWISGTVTKLVTK